MFLWFSVYSAPSQETAKHHAKFGWPPVSDVGAVTKSSQGRRHGWSGVDMSTPLLLEAILEIDANPVSLVAGRLVGAKSGFWEF